MASDEIYPLLATLKPLNNTANIILTIMATVESATSASDIARSLINGENVLDQLRANRQNEEGVSSAAPPAARTAEAEADTAVTAGRTETENRVEIRNQDGDQATFTRRGVQASNVTADNPL